MSILIFTGPSCGSYNAFVSSLLWRLPLPCCRILLFSQRNQLQPRPFYCVVCCCWCHIWVGLCLFSVSIRKKTNPNMLMGYAGPCGSHVMLLTLKPSLRRHRKQISAAMWCRIHLSPPRSLQPRPSFSMLRVVGKDLHCTIFVHICIYIYTHLYVCFLKVPAGKRTLDSRCTTLA